MNQAGPLRAAALKSERILDGNRWRDEALRSLESLKLLYSFLFSFGEPEGTAALAWLTTAWRPRRWRAELPGNELSDPRGR